MNRTIFSAIGVILTFAWIVYTAPGKQDKTGTSEDVQIKKISKSGSKSLNKITQPIYKKVQPDNINDNKAKVNSGSKILVIAANERTEQWAVINTKD